jgi:FtsH-binding integral membrane protein
MRITVARFLALALVVTAGTVFTAPAAQAAGKDHPSSNLPWVIGVVVVVVLLLAALMLKVRRGASKRDGSGHFRS